MEQLERIPFSGQRELLALADETLLDPAAFQAKTDAWTQAQGNMKTALAAEAEELKALQADHKRLHAVGVAALQAASVKIAELRSEAARNPAADLQALAEMSERERIKAAFIDSTVRELVVRLIPRQDLRVKQADLAVKQANTQVALHECVIVLADFIRLAAPLAEAMGTSGIDTPPRVQMFLDRTVRAWKEERGASETLVAASSAQAEMERSLCTTKLVTQ
jgi:hypothetical protein